MAFKQLACLKGHDDRVWDTKWNHKGTLLATASADRTVRVWRDTRAPQQSDRQSEGSDGTWATQWTLEGPHLRTVRRVSWSPDDRFLASASFDSTVCIWEKSDDDYDTFATLEGHENEVKSCAWSHNGEYIATCSRDKTVWIWERYEDEEEFDCCAIISDHKQDVKAVCWHPTQLVLASCSYDDTVKLHCQDPADPTEWHCYATLTGHTSTVWGIDFNATGEFMATVSGDNTLRIWQQEPHKDSSATRTDPGSYRHLCTLTGYHDRAVHDVSWQKHGNGLIATACGDNAIRVFRRASDNPLLFELAVTIENAHRQDVNCVEWHPTLSNVLASGSDDGEAKIWEIQLPPL